MMGRKPRHSDEKKREIAEYSFKHSAKEAVKKFSVSSNTVTNARKRFPLKSAKPEPVKMSVKSDNQNEPFASFGESLVRILNYSFWSGLEILARKFL